MSGEGMSRRSLPAPALTCGNAPRGEGRGESYVSPMGNESVGTNAGPSPALPVDKKRAAEARARGLLRERDALGLLAFERLQLRRRAERLERVRARTRVAVAARRTRQPAPDPLPLDGLTGGAVPEKMIMPLPDPRPVSRPLSAEAETIRDAGGAGDAR